MKRHWLLFTIFVVLGVWTLIPAKASKPCLIGYYAHCSFTPMSSITCFALAALFYWLGRRKAKGMQK